MSPIASADFACFGSASTLIGAILLPLFAELPLRAMLLLWGGVTMEFTLSLALLGGVSSRASFSRQCRLCHDVRVWRPRQASTGRRHDGHDGAAKTAAVRGDHLAVYLIYATIYRRSARGS
jgi:hypothetical protein